MHGGTKISVLLNQTHDIVPASITWAKYGDQHIEQHAVLCCSAPRGPITIIFVVGVEDDEVELVGLGLVITRSSSR